MSISPLITGPLTAPGLGGLPGLGGNFGCLTGTVRRITGPGIPLRGTHILAGPGGQTIASLRSGTVNLDLFDNRLVTVCGIIEPPVEGVTPILVTRVLPAPAVFPPFTPQRFRLQCFLVPV